MVASNEVIAASAPGDEIAGRDAAIADATGDRSFQLGELQIELGLADGGLLRGNRRLRDALCLRALVEGLLRDGLVAHQLLAAREVAFGERQVGARLRELCPGLRERRLEWPAVNGEQRIALLDDLSVLELDLVEIAGDARPDLDHVDRNKAPDIFVVVGHRLLHGLRDRHGGRGRSRLLRRLSAASKRERKNKQEGKTRRQQLRHRSFVQIFGDARRHRDGPSFTSSHVSAAQQVKRALFRPRPVHPISANGTRVYPPENHAGFQPKRSSSTRT